MWGQPLSAVRAERSSAALLELCGAAGSRRALLARTAESGCPHMGIDVSRVIVCPHLFSYELRQVFPEEFAAVDDPAAAHVEEINCEHPVFIVIAEDIGVVAFGGGDALALLQLLDGGNQIAITRGALVFLIGRRLFHACVQGLA